MGMPPPASPFGTPPPSSSSISAPPSSCQVWNICCAPSLPWCRVQLPQDIQSRWLPLSGKSMPTVGTNDDDDVPRCCFPRPRPITHHLHQLLKLSMVSFDVAVTK